MLNPKQMMGSTALAPIEGKAVRSVNALLPIGVMLVGMVYGTLASGVEQHYLQVGFLSSGFHFFRCCLVFLMILIVLLGKRCY